MRDALNEITREQQAVQLKDKEALKLAEAANMAALARQDEAARGLARALVFAEQRETEVFAEQRETKVFAEQRETEAERKASEAAATMEPPLWPQPLGRPRLTSGSLLRWLKQPRGCRRLPVSPMKL